MRRIRLPLRRAALFVLLLLFMLAITLPLRLALGIMGFDERGLAAREAEGSVWAGELADARFGVVALGDAVTRLSFFPLFLGQAELNMDGPEGAPFRGELTGYRSGFAIEDAQAAVPLAALGLPSAGALILSDFSVRFEDGLCIAAAGAAAVDVVAAPAAGLDLPEVALTGAPVCDADRLLVPLRGQSGSAVMELNIALPGNGPATGTLLISGLDPLYEPALLAQGFRAAGRGYRYTF